MYSWIKQLFTPKTVRISKGLLFLSLALLILFTEPNQPVNLYIPVTIVAIDGGFILFSWLLARRLSSLDMETIAIVSSLFGGILFLLLQFKHQWFPIETWQAVTVTVLTTVAFNYMMVDPTTSSPL